MSHWEITRFVGFAYGQSHPWATKVNYCGGLMDCCGMWRDFCPAANDEQQPNRLDACLVGENHTESPCRATDAANFLTLPMP